MANLGYSTGLRRHFADPKVPERVKPGLFVGVGLFYCTAAVVAGMATFK
jgi:hypothetical protein